MKSLLTAFEDWMILIDFPVLILILHLSVFSLNFWFRSMRSFVSVVYQ